jgi:hypothetical protein
MSLVNTLEILRVFKDPYANRVFRLFSDWSSCKEASEKYEDLNEVDYENEQIIEAVLLENKDKVLNIRQLYKICKRRFTRPIPFYDFKKEIASIFSLRYKNLFQNLRKVKPPEGLNVRYVSKKVKMNPVVYSRFKIFKKLGWLEGRIITKEKERVSKKGKIFTFHDTSERYRICLYRVVSDFIRTRYPFRTHLQKFTKKDELAIKIIFSNEAIWNSIKMYLYKTSDELFSIPSFIEKILFEFFVFAYDYKLDKEDRAFVFSVTKDKKNVSKLIDELNRFLHSASLNKVYRILLEVSKVYSNDLENKIIYSVFDPPLTEAIISAKYQERIT